MVKLIIVEEGHPADVFGAAPACLPEWPLAKGMGWITPLAFLVRPAARNFQQPCLGIESLDNMLYRNRHELLGAQPGVVSSGKNGAVKS